MKSLHQLRRDQLAKGGPGSGIYERHPKGGKEDMPQSELDRAEEQSKEKAADKYKEAYGDETKRPGSEVPGPKSKEYAENYDKAVNELKATPEQAEKYATAYSSAEAESLYAAATEAIDRTEGVSVDDDIPEEEQEDANREHFDDVVKEYDYEGAGVNFNDFANMANHMYDNPDDDAKARFAEQRAGIGRGEWETNWS